MDPSNTPECHPNNSTNTLQVDEPWLDKAVKATVLNCTFNSLNVWFIEISSTVLLILTQTLNIFDRCCAGKDQIQVLIIQTSLKYIYNIMQFSDLFLYLHRHKTAFMHSVQFHWFGNKLNKFHGINISSSDLQFCRVSQKKD